MLLLMTPLCLGVMLAGPSNAQTPLSKERYALKGPVRTVSAERVRLSNEEKELNRKKLDIVSYDESGRPNGRDVYDDYGFFVGREFYEYGPTGLLSRSTLSDATGKRIELRTHRYDAKGKTSSINTYDATGQLKFRQLFRHDLKANWVEETTSTSNRVIEKKISKLDSNGASKEVDYYDVRGKLTEKWSFTYDASGNLKEETLYNPDGSLRKRFVHTYELDAHGNWICRRTTVTLNSPSEPVYESTFITYRTIKYSDGTAVRLNF